ncbi:MAG: NADH-quinone oxidoreductase subunit NuoE [Bdellovibrionia bacterium]
MFQLSKEGKDFVKKELTRYEDKMSAIIPALYRAQAEHGWISNDVVEHLAQVMELPASRIHEVATFYTMFNLKPVGKYHVQVCGNISCAMAGSREILGAMLEKHHVGLGEKTKDGKYTFSKVECLGSCGTAPMMQINEDYHENLDMKKADEIVRGLK